ncbi:MAG: DUF664 domain-containing protein [Caldilineaceae bacterium]|nr:DUF664 domain-containing protein [Caldilineaceae bacterium]
MASRRGNDAHELNSLAVLATHVAGAERFWIHEVIDRQPALRDRDAEFGAVASDSEQLRQRLAATGDETQRVFDGLTLAGLDATRTVRDKIVPVRWAILHVIDHTALHLGHMQITYQLWRGGSAYNSPRWHQRLPAE